MKLRNPVLIKLAALLGAAAIRWWMGTVRYRFAFHDPRTDPNSPALAGRYIYAFWHEHLLFPAARKPGSRVFVLISQHADGELIARVCRHLGFHTVRGSTTRGGVPAVRALLRQSRRGHLAVTPDGPRGPRRRVQPGIIYLAARTGLPIVPAGIGYQRAWRARSWDRFAVPKPFSTATCVTAPTVWVPPDLDRDALEEYRRRVEQAMLEATEAAERWALRL